MNEDKVKEIFCQYCFSYPHCKVENYDFTKCNYAKESAKQIADLYKPPKELELSDEEMGHDAGCRKLYGDGSCNCGSERTAKAQLTKARLYYEPKGDGEGLLTDEEIMKAHEGEKCRDCGRSIAKAQKRLDDINKEKEIEGIFEVATKRIDALQGLLAFYRIGKRPTEKLFNQLEKTEKDLQALKAKHLRKGG